MLFAVDLITQDLVQHNIFRAAKEIFLNLGIGLFELRDQVLSLQSLGTDAAGQGAQGILFCKFARTLQKAQTVVIAPCFDVFLADQIHRADQFHTFEVGAPEFGHHSLILTGVEHSHQNCLDGIVIVVSQRYFVASKTFSSAVQISPSHSRTEIARGFFNMKDGVEDRRVEDRDRNPEDAAVFFDQRPVFRKIPGIHTQKRQFEGKLVMPLDLLKELGHQHGILAAGDTDGDVVSLLDQSILNDSLFKAALQIVLKLFPNTFFNVFLTGGGIVPIQGSSVKSCQFTPR